VVELVRELASHFEGYAGGLGLRSRLVRRPRPRPDHERLLTGIAGPGARLYVDPGLGQRLAVE